MKKFFIYLIVLMLSFIESAAFGQEKGLALVIRAQQQRYLVGEPIIVSVVLQNGLGQAKSIPSGFAHNVSFDITHTDGERARYIGPRITREIGLSVLVPLEPKGVLRTEENLFDNYSKLST